MTEEKLDAMIREVIIEQMKPQSTRNSYFRKQEDKRRLMRFIPIKRLKNIAEDFYMHFNKLRIVGKEEWYRNMYWGNKNYMHIWGIGNFGVVYNGLTNRIKKSLDYRARKDVRNKRLIKRIQRRQPRKCKFEIANGAEYKKIKMRIPTIG